MNIDSALASPAAFDEVRWGSIRVVETFFGSEDGREILSRVGSAPLEQLHELASRIHDLQPVILEALEPLTGTPIVMNESFYFDRSYDAAILAQKPDFKRWFLMTDHLAIPDPGFAWAYTLIGGYQAYGDAYFSPASSANVREHLKDAIEGLLKWRPLVESAGVFLIPGHEHIRSDIWLPGSALEYVSTPPIFLESARWQDPLLAALVVGEVDEWVLEARQLTDSLGWLSVLPSITEAACELVDSEEITSATELWAKAELGLKSLAAHELESQAHRTFALAAFQRDFRVLPAPTSALSFRHLMRATDVTLEGEERPLRYEESVTRLPLPDLSEFGLRDLVSLRTDHETLARVRGALVELAGAVEGQPLGTSAELRSAVREAANDIVRPICEQFGKEVRHNGYLSRVAGAAAGAAAKFAVGGIASLTAAPYAAGPAGSAAGRIASRTTRGSLAKRSRTRAIAQSILLTTLPADHDYDGWMADES